MAVQMTYCGPAPSPGAFIGAWNLDPVLLIALAVGAIVLWRLADQRRWAAITVLGLAVAFVSPLCALTVALFSARTVHHIVLLSWIAPALALALPMGRRVSGPAALMATVAALLAWHVPSVYGAGWVDPVVYWALQGAVLIPAWVLWSGILRPIGSAAPLRSAALIAGLAIAMGFLGAILTFAPHVLYVEHLPGAALWAMDPLADQQLAGLLMWVPGFVPLMAVAGRLLTRAWRDSLTLTETRP